MSRPWRLIVHPPGDGAWNMAVDEVLLESVLRTSGAPPTLRFYQWSPPCLSLGRLQPASVVRLGALREDAVHLVRRPTGGRAVLHDAEVTYALAAREGEDRLPRGVAAIYDAVAECLVAGLHVLGVEARSVRRPRRAPSPRGRAAVCFDNAVGSEIVVEGRKILGSAMLRRHGAVLQHGSLPLRSFAARLRKLVQGEGGEEGRFTDLARVLGREVEPQPVIEALITGFRRAWGVDLEPAGLTEEERVRAHAKRAQTYLSAAWTLHARR